MAEHQEDPIVPASPRVPRRPEEITPEWAYQFTRWVEGFVELQTRLSFGRFSGLYLPVLPTTAYGLKPGEVFSNGGILTVVRETDAWTGELDAITVHLGSVTVS